MAALASCTNDSNGGGSSVFSSDPPTAELVANLTATTGEEGSVDGLFGLAISPDGNHLFTLRNVRGGDLRLEKFPYRPGREIDPASGTVVWSVPHPFVHNGGGLQFLPSGDLLMAVVARIDGLDTTAAPLQSPDGVILRIPATYLTDESASPFVPTADNVIARGLRNPFRISYDAATGDLWIGDNGETAVEEIDRIPGDQLGKIVPNFGWPYYEASTVNITPPNGVEFTPPVIEYPHSDGRCSVLGGLVYHGTTLKGLDKAYIFGDFCGPTYRALIGDMAKPTAVDIGQAPSSPTRFVEAPDGSVYVLAGDDRVYVVTSNDDSTPSKPKVDIGLFATLYPSDVQAGQRHESADMVLGPKGDELLVAERSGLIGRLRLDHGKAAENPGTPMAKGLTTYDFGTVTKATCDVGASARVAGFESPTPSEVQTNVTDAQDQMRRLAPTLPPRLASDASTVQAALDEISAAGSAAGWDVQNASFRDALRTVLAERGPHAESYYAAQMISNHLGQCAEHRQG